MIMVMIMIMMMVITTVTMMMMMMMMMMMSGYMNSSMVCCLLNFINCRYFMIFLQLTVVSLVSSTNVVMLSVAFVKTSGFSGFRGTGCPMGTDLLFCD